MADPFSIVSGTIGILDVCTKLGKLIWDINQGRKTIDQDLVDLEKQVNSLYDVCTTIQQLWTTSQSHEKVQPSIDEDSGDSESSLWRMVQNTLIDCNNVASKLELEVSKIRGHQSGSSTSQLESIRQFLRKRSREEHVREQLNAFNTALQTFLMAIS